MNLDLEAGHLKEVRKILGQVAPGISVWAFGSRVTGKAKRFSDLDLAVVAGKPVSRQTLWEIREAFSESELPFRVDVIDLASVPKEFRTAVEGAHRVIQGP